MIKIPRLSLEQVRKRMYPYVCKCIDIYISMCVYVYQLSVNQISIILYHLFTLLHNYIYYLLLSLHLSVIYLLLINLSRIQPLWLVIKKDNIYPYFVFIMIRRNTVQQTHSKHYSKWRQTDRISTKIRVKMPTFTSYSKQCVTSQLQQLSKGKYKRDKHRKGRSHAMSACR